MAIDDSHTPKELLRRYPQLITEEYMAFLIQGVDHHLCRMEHDQSERLAAGAEYVWDELGQPMIAPALHLADRWQRLLRPKDADRVLQGLIRTADDPRPLVLMLGWLHYENGKRDEGVSCWEQVWPEVQEGPAFELAFCAAGLFVNAIESSDLDTAESYLPAMAKHPMTMPAAEPAGRLLRACRDGAADADLALRWHSLGVGFYQMRNFVQAIHCYKRAIEWPASSSA